MTEKTALTKIQESNQLADLLYSIGWEAVVQPKLHNLQESLSSLLVSSVLGRTITSIDTNGVASAVTKEQLAGQIEGLKFIEDLFTKILRDGDAARKYIENYGDSFQVN